MDFGKAFDVLAAKFAISAGIWRYRAERTALESGQIANALLAEGRGSSNSPTQPST
jgi:hypothetical protein